MKNKWLYIVITVPFIVGLVLGSFFDLQISTSLYSAFGDPSKNVFGLIFSAFMPLFSYASLSFFGGYAVRFGLDQEKWWQKLIFIVGGIGCFAFTILYTGDKIASPNAFNDESLNLMGYAIGLIVEGGIAVFGYFVGRKRHNATYAFSMIVIFVFMSLCFITYTFIIKEAFRRPRFRCISDVTEFFVPGAKYIDWWVPFRSEYLKIDEALSPILGHDYISEGFKSFPSGHTSEAAVMIFGLPYLSLVIPKLKGKESILLLVGFAFTVIMAFSRITMGAHYLSDVSMGGLLMSSFLIVGNEINLSYTLKKIPEHK